jgi:hypothetical protein
MSSAPERWLPQREAACVAALAALAALRVALFAGAFPFFANVDEQKHVDMVLKYARGYLPEPGREAYEPQMGQLVGLYGSPEYLSGPGEIVPPPPWRRAPGAMVGVVELSERFLAERANKEAEQPPAYYATAALGLGLGRALGLEGARLLYFVRGLGALVAAALVWVAHRLVRDAYRDEPLVRWGVPVLACVFPQDTLFYVTPDVLSPLLGGAVFALSLRLAGRPESGRGAYAACGLLLAAALLTKWTNAALALVAAAASLHALAHAPWPGGRRALLGRLGWQWGLALAPVVWWCGRSLHLYGDPTASSLKVARLGWRPKPLADWLEHPLFTPAGLADFAGGLVPTFWRGELAWHRVDLALPALDAHYTATTLHFLALAAVGLRRREPRRFLAEGLAGLGLATAAATLAALSLAFVFDETTNPPASRPYFVQGRLISGVLLPFLLLYARGISFAASRLPARAGHAAGALLIGALALAITASELALAWPVFASRYNLYHLP